MNREATAFAPASVGNVAVGYDVLGNALDDLGDRVTVRRLDAPDIRVGAITGRVVAAETQEPLDGAQVFVAGLIMGGLDIGDYTLEDFTW